MALDRAAIVTKADALVRQGKVDEAIAELRRLVDEQPGDVSAANTLGDLYARSGDLERAVDQFARLADAERAQGFTSKAVALYKKALKADPAAERILSSLADIVSGQELFADAMLYLNRLLQAQRARGDGAAVAETLGRLASLPSASIDTRLAAARACDEHKGAEASAPLFASAAQGLDAAGRSPEAIDAWLAAASRTTDLSVRRAAAVSCLRAGELERAEAFLTIEVAGDHAELLWAVAERAANRNDEATARDAGRRLSAVRPDEAARVDVLLGRWPVEHRAAAIEDAWPAVDMESVFSDVPTVETPTAIDAMDALERFGVVQAVGSDVEPEPVEPEAGECTAVEPPTVATKLVLVPAAPMADEEIVLDIDAFGDPPAEVPPAAGVAAPIVPDAPVPDAPNVAMTVGAPVTPLVTPSAETAAATHAEAIPARTSPVPPPAPLPAAISTPRGAPPDVDPPDAEPPALDADGLVSQLELAARAPALRFQASAQLGRFHAAKGRWAEAIRWLDAAAEAQAASRDQRLSVLYDLADALERAGDSERSIAVWSDLELEAGSYRDVATRLTRLASLVPAADR